jgi:hypothetical protein
MSVQYQYTVSKVSVQCQYSVSTVAAQCQHSVSTVSAQCQAGVSTVSIPHTVLYARPAVVMQALHGPIVCEDRFHICRCNVIRV